MTGSGTDQMSSSGRNSCNFRDQPFAPHAFERRAQLLKRLRPNDAEVQ